MFNCIIVDDQRVAIEVIEQHLKKIEEFNLIATFTKPIEALDFLQKNDVDLVFLDVQMPDLDGLEIIESLRVKRANKTPSFIIITGHSQYAVSGYEIGLVDYLLKPVSFKRFKIAVDRFLEMQPKSKIINEVSQEKDYFFIESEGSKLKLNYKSIAYIESDRNCIHIIENKSKRTIYKPMHYIETILASHDDFIRVHKSYIISINYIEVVKVNEVVINVDGNKKTISIGGTYKDNFLKKLK